MIELLKKLCGVLLIVLGGVPICIVVAVIMPVLALGLVAGCVAAVGLSLVID